jgi:hypothetical protein
MVLDSPITLEQLGLLDLLDLLDLLGLLGPLQQRQAVTEEGQGCHHGQVSQVCQVGQVVIRARERMEVS